MKNASTTPRIPNTRFTSFRELADACKRADQEAAARLRRTRRAREANARRAAEKAS